MQRETTIVPPDMYVRASGNQPSSEIDVALFNGTVQTTHKKCCAPLSFIVYCPRSSIVEPPFYNCDVALRRSRSNVTWYNHRLYYTASSSPKACIKITDPTKKQTDLWSQARAKTPFIVAHTLVNLTRARPS